jgi:hypothetical protein
MPGQKRVFIGVSPLIPHLSYNMVVLDGGLHVLEKSEGELEEIITFILTKEEATVALNFPRQLNQGMAKTIQVKHIGPGRPSTRAQNMRLCESVLHKLGIRGVLTPAELEHCPLWMRQGFVFYERLEEAGFACFSAEDAARHYLETQVEGVFRAILGQPLLNQRSLEGRIQRQLVLFERGLRIADPMDFFEEITRHRLIQGSLPLQKLYSLPELDAMAAAYMGWYAVNHSQQLSQVGDPLEGTLILPYLKDLDTQFQTDTQQMTIFS